VTKRSCSPSLSPLARGHKLVRSIRDLLGLLEYPCSRGNADLSADLLYPFIEPLLVKNWHEITQEDMFPVLEMLRSGM
jgi:hypothetical protein